MPVARRRLDNAVSPASPPPGSPGNGLSLEELRHGGTVFGAVEIARLVVDLCRRLLAHRSADPDLPSLLCSFDETSGRVAFVAPGEGGPDPTDAALYTAPEVLRGEPATRQSDVYSVGVLLFRLSTKTLPVAAEAVQRGQHMDAWNAREDLRSSGAVPLPLARVIERAIDPRLDVRYATVEALCAELEWVAGVLLATRAPASRLTRYGAVLAGVLALAALAWAVAYAPLERPILALRFAHGGRPSVDASAVADGVTVEITRLLAQVEGLDVRAAVPSSADRYETRDAIAFGAQRKATIVLRGTLHGNAGAWQAIEVSLVGVRDGRTIWSESFPVAHDDVFAVQKRIAAAVAGELKLAFDPERHRYSTPPRLQELFLRARALQTTPSDVTRLHAADLFERIAGEDPAFVPAVAALAATLGGVRADSPDLPVLDPRMAPAARRAYVAAPRLAEANAAMGLLSAHRCDWRKAKEYFTQALALDRSVTSAYVGYAISTLLPLGETREALVVLKAAVQADPMSVGVRNALAHVLVENGDLDLAIETSRDLVKEAPGLESADHTLNRALYLSGRMERPSEAFSRDAQWAYRAYVRAVLGRRDEAMRLAESHPREPARQMLIYAGLHDRDRAFTALQRTARLSPWRALTWMRRVEIEPVFRGDPRAAALRARLLQSAGAAGCAIDGPPPSGATHTLSDPDADLRLGRSGGGRAAPTAH